MKNRIIASIVGIVIVSGIFLGWLFLHSSNSIVPVTGTIPGQPNKQIKIGNETVKTDNYGQFFIHIFTNKTYKINSGKIHFTIKANKNGKVKTTGNVKKNLVLSTPQKTVQMTIKSGVPYFDNNSHYFYNENTHKLTLTTNFQLKKGDKIVLSPKQNNSGLAFTINTISESNGQVQATVTPTKIQNVLNDFQIHTGEVEGNDLTTSNTSVASLRPMDLTIGNDKKSKWIHQDIIAKLKPQSSAKHHTLSGNVTGSTDISGSFQIDANYDFLNPNNDYIKSKSSLSVSEQLAAEFKADYSLKDENGNLITIATYDTPIPFVKVPIQMYLNASADVSAKLHTSFSPTITANATFKNGFQLNYNKAVPQVDFSFDGKIKGDEGFVIGPDITAYVTDLFTIGAKVGFDGNAEVNGQLSTSGNNSFTGTGNLNFGVYILATSPFLDELSGKKGKFTVEKQIIKNLVFEEKVKRTSKSKTKTSKEKHLRADKLTTQQTIGISNDFAQYLKDNVATNGQSVSKPQPISHYQFYANMYIETDKGLKIQADYSSYQEQILSKLYTTHTLGVYRASSDFLTNESNLNARDNSNYYGEFFIYTDKRGARALNQEPNDDIPMSADWDMYIDDTKASYYYVLADDGNVYLATANGNNGYAYGHYFPTQAEMLKLGSLSDEYKRYLQSGQEANFSPTVFFKIANSKLQNEYQKLIKKYMSTSVKSRETMNIQQIQKGDYSSIAGKWVSRNSKFKLTFTSTYASGIDGVQSKIGSFRIPSNEVSNGSEMLAGELGNGIGGAAIYFIPAGVTLGNTDSTKDRIFVAQQSLMVLDPSNQYYYPDAEKNVMYKQ